MGEGYRELEIDIGPLREFETPQGSTATGIHIVSNGNVDTLKVHVSCEKYIQSAPQMCYISIWNLRIETINAIRTAGADVKVYVGYEGQTKEEKNLLYSGSIQAVKTDRQGPDFVTTIIAMAVGSGSIRAVTSSSYAAGVDLKSAVMELVKQVPGVTPDPANINIKGTIGYAGWSFVGSVKEALNKLAYQFGFSWRFENGVFKATQDGEYSGTVVILNSANGLRKVSPRLTGPTQIQEGVDISTQYVPNVGPGDNVKVVSEMNPYLNDTYQCHTVGFELCPKENTWDMTISSFKMRQSFSEWRQENYGDDYEYIPDEEFPEEYPYDDEYPEENESEGQNG